jgi:hypothetical protein
MNTSDQLYESLQAARSERLNRETVAYYQELREAEQASVAPSEPLKGDGWCQLGNVLGGVLLFGVLVPCLFTLLGVTMFFPN